MGRCKLESVLGAKSIDTLVVTGGAFLAAVKARLSDIVDAGLSHKLAEIRTATLLALAPAAGEPLPASLKALAADKGHRVRRPLVDIARENPHSDNADALAILANDTWTRWSHHAYDADHPIARAAAAELRRLPDISDATFEALRTPITKTNLSFLVWARRLQRFWPSPASSLSPGCSLRTSIAALSVGH